MDTSLKNSKGIYLLEQKAIQRQFDTNIWNLKQSQQTHVFLVQELICL